MSIPGPPSLRLVLVRMVSALAGVLAVLMAIAFLGMVLTAREYRQGSQLGVARQETAAIVLTDLLGAESSSRGYTLTGRESYLALFRSAKTSYPNNMKRMESRLNGLPALQERARVVRGAGNAWFAEATEMVRLRQSGQTSKATELVNSGRPKALQDAFRLEHRALLADIAAERRASLSRADSRRRITLGFVAVSALAALGVIALIARRLWRRVGGPVGDLDQGVHRVAAGDLGTPVGLRPSAVRELGGLVTGFNQMQVDLAAQRELAVQSSRRDAAQQAERELWKTVQSGLLPARLPRAPWFRLEAKYRPSEADLLIGGDFYDAIILDDGRLCVVIGDVSGHGAPAAAKAAGLRFAWRTITQVDPSPRAVLEALNNQIGSAEERASGRFASMLHILISPDGSCEMTPAGHPAPILLTADSCKQIDIAEPGPPIGIFDDAVWPVIQFQLPEGGTLFLFTDGLVEARRDGELFGVDGVCSLLERERGVALEERISRLIDAARRFDAANLRDDVVLMAIDRPRPL